MIKISKYSDILGWGNFNLIYKELLLTLPTNASILEIGVGYGRGTWAMLDAMTDHMSLFVVDTFENEIYKKILRKNSLPRTLSPKNYKRFRKMLPNISQKEMFINNISQHTRVLQLSEVYEMSSFDYINQNKKNNFDLVFLDANHFYETVSTELEYFKDCTMITGHDYNPNFIGVVKAVDEFMKKNKDRKFKVFEDEHVFVIEK
jgi:hypothetical protein